jgi:hypothetical protein
MNDDVIYLEKVLVLVQVQELFVKKKKPNKEK